MYHILDILCVCELKVKDKFIYKLNRNYNTCFYVKKIVQIVQLGKLALREDKRVGISPQTHGLICDFKFIYGKFYGLKRSTLSVAMYH